MVGLKPVFWLRQERFGIGFESSIASRVLL
jgi:hypothetical protein